MKLGDSQSSKQDNSQIERPRVPQISIVAESENPVANDVDSCVVNDDVDSCKNMPQSKDFNTLGYDLVAPKRKITDRVKLDIMQSPRKRPSFENEQSSDSSVEATERKPLHDLEIPKRKVSGFCESPSINTPIRKVSGFLDMTSQKNVQEVEEIHSGSQIDVETFSDTKDKFMSF